MYVKQYFSVLLVAVLLLSACGKLVEETNPIFSRSTCGSEFQNNATSIESLPCSCTTFAAAYGNTVLFGNNEDFNKPVTYLWTVPPGEGTCGGVYLGYGYGCPQDGINEKGLVFDGLALSEARLNPHPDLPPKGRGDTQFLGKILSHCATVEQAIAFAQSFDWGSSISFQALLADASGDEVVISAGPDGELAFTRKPDLKAGYFQAILDAVHVEGAGNNTLYTNVFDLRNGVIDLTFWHQFGEIVALNVAELIDKGAPAVRLSALFSEETVNQAKQEYQQHLDQAARDAWLNQNGKVLIIGEGGVILGLLGLVVYLFIRRNKRD